MRALIRLIALVTALCFAGSGSLSAMPLVWCIGNDGHRAVEAILHQHAVPADTLADEGMGDRSHTDTCSDLQLLGTAGQPQAKSLDAKPKTLTVVMAYPPLKQVVEASSPPKLARNAACFLAAPTPSLSALRSVVLLI
jgi:hypothetical protein